MTRKADFNAEEWETIVQGPPLAGLRVIVADRGGTLRESVSMAETYAAARRERGESELLDAIVASPPLVDPGQAATPEASQRRAIERLGEAMRILREKATEQDVEAYRQFVLTLADHVARAHKEGGFLGIGGKEISESEQQALDEIAAALN